MIRGGLCRVRRRFDEKLGPDTAEYQQRCNMQVVLNFNQPSIHLIISQKSSSPMLSCISTLTDKRKEATTKSARKDPAQA
jgi:hypothetical protein